MQRYSSFENFDSYSKFCALGLLCDTAHNSWISPCCHIPLSIDSLPTSLQTESIFCPSDSSSVLLLLILHALNPFIHSLVVFLPSFTATSFTEEVCPSPTSTYSLKPSLVFCFDRLLTGPQFFVSFCFLLLFSQNSIFLTENPTTLHSEERLNRTERATANAVTWMPLYIQIN